MASITIRNIDEALKSRLRIHAARHRRSMEVEAREILRSAVAGEASRELDLAQAIRRHIDPPGGADIVLPPRGPVRRPPKFT